ncbi:MAG: hypothetical protein HDS89_05895 [Bacteroidales bacterium]|nr:hypothetical protein [Bacteroidales bacterium]
MDSIWKATAIKAYNDGKRQVAPGMSVEFTANSYASPSTVWQNQNQLKIAEALVLKYNLNCTAKDMMHLVSNSYFEFKKL